MMSFTHQKISIFKLSYTENKAQMDTAKTKVEL